MTLNMKTIKQSDKTYFKKIKDLFDKGENFMGNGTTFAIFDINFFSIELVFQPPLPYQHFPYFP